MAEFGEWNEKGATLSNVTAQAEYGVTRAFIIEGIQKGKLECREGAIWGNPYLRIIRRQLEAYITEELGAPYLARVKSQAELAKVKKEISGLKKRLNALEVRRKDLEKILN